MSVLEDVSQLAFGSIRHLVLTIGLLLASLILFVIASATIHAVTGNRSSMLVAVWGIGTIIAYRYCRHHVF